MPRWERVGRFICRQSVCLGLSQTMAFSSWLPLSAVGGVGPTIGCREVGPTIGCREVGPTIGCREVGPIVGCREVGPIFSYREVGPLVDRG